MKSLRPVVGAIRWDAWHGEAVQQARKVLDTRPANQRILSLYAWNEWTEAGYFEAIRDVFS